MTGFVVSGFNSDIFHKSHKFIVFNVIKTGLTCLYVGGGAGPTGVIPVLATLFVSTAPFMFIFHPLNTKRGSGEFRGQV